MRTARTLGSVPSVAAELVGSACPSFPVVSRPMRDVAALPAGAADGRQRIALLPVSFQCCTVMYILALAAWHSPPDVSVWF
jgi:hypothetical protein